VSTLRFLSWMRRGLVSSIAAPADADGLPTSAALDVRVTLTTGADEVHRDVRVLGPDAVRGVVASEVVRRVPAPGATDHESHFFATVELATPDLPWLFTPASPTADRLAPWLALVVVEVRAGVQLEAVDGRSVLVVDEADRELPRLREAWAWAHVAIATDTEDLEAALRDEPEAFTSRLMAARHLRPGTEYRACLVPTFDAGRRAGLGLEPPEDPTALAWEDGARDVRLPVYVSWTFRTHPEPGDFEELVRRLQPTPLDDATGAHDLSLADPGTTRLPPVGEPVSYVGALRSSSLEPRPWDDPERGAHQDAMGELLADAEPSSWDGVEPYDARRHDPVVAPPRYGSLPSGVDAVPTRDAPVAEQTPRWMAEANLDTRHRVVAGLGAEVVRRNQENLMAAAWDQAQGIDRVRALLRRTTLALAAGERAKVRLDQLTDGSLVQLSAAAHPRLATAPRKTVRARVGESGLPRGLVSAAMRRQARPGSPLDRGLAKEAATVGLTARVTTQYATRPSAMLAYAKLTIPHGAVLESGATRDALRGRSIASASIDRVDGSAVRDALARSNTPSSRRLRSRLERDASSERRRSPRVRPSPAPAVATRAELFEVADAAVVAAAMSGPTVTRLSAYGAIDLLVSHRGTGTSEAVVDLASIAADVRRTLDPTPALRARLRRVVRPADALGDEDVPASLFVPLTLPEPLYRWLVAIDPELLMPGVGDLAPESVGAAVVEQPFVEAFLLGANHELARELLWREYPAELTGTFLSTFWDSVDGSGGGDIAPIDAWEPEALGTHHGPIDPGQVLVLILKGELLRRYPDTAIYAAPARWGDDGRREEDPNGEAVDPIFAGTLGGDVRFLGFAFDAAVDVPADLRGSSDAADETPGWYFAFEQPPTEPAFGLDTAATDESPDLARWADLTWADVGVEATASYVPLAALTASLPYDTLGANQFDETWARSASAMARITLQRPVRMLVHADQLLDPEDPDA